MGWYDRKHLSFGRENCHGAIVFLLKLRLFCGDGYIDKYFVFPLPFPHLYPGWCGNKKTFACAWDTGLLWSKHPLQAGMEKGRIEFKRTKAQSSGPPTSPRLRLWDTCFGKLAHFSELIASLKIRNAKQKQSKREKRQRKKQHSTRNGKT